MDEPDLRPRHPSASDEHLSRVPDDFRHERKAFVDGVSAQEVEHTVKRHPAFFREIYHRRNINNIYFDTVDYNAYEQNLEGDAEREKIRLRWYGELLGRIDGGVLEFKVKSNALGLKKQYPVRPFVFFAGCPPCTIRQAISDSCLPAVAGLAVARQEPKLVNRYARRYFESSCRRFRITIDNEIEFYRADGMRLSLVRREVDRETVIVEIKYHGRDDDDAAAIISQLPYPLTKSSKYVYGLQRLWGFQ